MAIKVFDDFGDMFVKAIGLSYLMKPLQSHAWYSSPSSGQDSNRACDSGLDSMYADMVDGAGPIIYIEPTYDTTPQTDIAARWKMVFKKESRSDPNTIGTNYVDDTYSKVSISSSGRTRKVTFIAKFENSTDRFGDTAPATDASISAITLKGLALNDDTYATKFLSNDNDNSGGTKRMPDYVGVVSTDLTLGTITFDTARTITAGSYYQVNLSLGIITTDANS